MLLTEQSIATLKGKRMLQHYMKLAEVNGYSRDTREIRPEHLLEWVYTLFSQGNLDLKKINDFHEAFYYLLGENSHRITLFFKKQYLPAILSCRIFNASLLVRLFELFFYGSQAFATNSKGKDMIKTIPESLVPEDRSAYKLEKLLWSINDCFRVSVVIDFYVWLLESRVVVKDYDALISAIQKYRITMIPKSKPRITHRFLLPVLEYLARLPNATITIETGSVKYAANISGLDLEEDPPAPSPLELIEDGKAYTIAELMNLKILRYSRQHISRLCTSGKIVSHQAAGSGGKRLIYGSDAKHFAINS